MDRFDLREWQGFGVAGGNLQESAWVDQVVIDSRRIESSQAVFIALPGNREDGAAYVRHAAEAGAKFALVPVAWNPPSDLPNITLLKVPEPLKALQEIAGTYRRKLGLKLVGIGGSFGKTMVKDLLQTILKTEKKTAASPESFNSQIGVALSLFTLHKGDEIGLIEAAISETSEMDKLAELILPDYAILTPIGKKHLPTLGNLQNLAGEMMKLVLKTPSDGWALLPQNSLITPYLSFCSSSLYFWNEIDSRLPHAQSIQSQTNTQGSYALSFPKGSSFKGEMQGGYRYFLNLINIVSKAAWLLGISESNIVRVLQEYQLEPARTEIWKSSQGALFFNETYCSDPQSVSHALRYFEQAQADQRKLFIFGGMRGALVSQTAYQSVGKAIAKNPPQTLLLHGSKPYKPLIEELERSAPETEILSFLDTPDMFEYLRNYLRTGDFVLVKGEKKVSLERIANVCGESINHNRCLINLAAIRNNLELIRNQAGRQTRLMLMIKAFGYGTDHLLMARFYATCGVDILGVSYLEEALALKRGGVTQSIFTLNTTPDEIESLIHWGIETGVSDASFIQQLGCAAEREQKKIKVHLHVDTGMGRLGCRPEDALSLARLIREQKNLILEGLMTHFSSADNPSEDAFTLNQAARFDAVLEQLQGEGFSIPWVHASNSSATARFSFSKYNMVRVGLAAYGLYTSLHVKEALDLKLALSLTSCIVGFNICRKDESVGYERSHLVSREVERIAILPIGYFDGLHRSYSGKPHFLIRGKKARLLGNICMDYTMVDVTDIPDAAVGDPVLIFGEDEYGHYLSPEELAAQGQSNAHELMTCLGPRIQRIFIQEEGEHSR